jgi:hypothetical protein
MPGVWPCWGRRLIRRWGNSSANQTVTRCWPLVLLGPRCRPSRRWDIRRRRRRNRYMVISEIEGGPRVPESLETTGGIRRAAGKQFWRSVGAHPTRQIIIPRCCDDDKHVVVHEMMARSWPWERLECPMPFFHQQEQKRDPFGCQTWKSALYVRQRADIFRSFTRLFLVSVA